MMGAHRGITKGAEDPAAFRRPLFQFERARDAFLGLLKAMGFAPGDRVLLPAYVGSSPKEGCWALDALEGVGGLPVFYRLTGKLDVDLPSFLPLLGLSRVRVAVVTHFFGFKCASTAAAVKVARSAGLVTVEDCAHALLTDWVGGICGRTADAALYSFHKILPVETGGGLVLNTSGMARCIERLGGADRKVGSRLDPLQFDLVSIARARRKNAVELLRLMQPHEGLMVPLFSAVPRRMVPQTLPFLVKLGDRDKLYEEMNSAGFGVVSLYHTLAPGIVGRTFHDSVELSRSILNFPVHQDADSAGLAEMVQCCVALLKADGGLRRVPRL